jgi:glycerophosphoryl diester phosphodiesterase
MGVSTMRFVGHRGASARDAENTKTSISRALELSDGAEFDIQRTSDGVLVVLHDDTLARTAAAWAVKTSSMSEDAYEELVRTPVNELTWDQVKQVRVGK